MDKLNNIILAIHDAVWGTPMIAVILAVGIILTVMLRGVHLRNLPRAFKYMFNDEENGVGDVSSFGALCTALSATIGTGNIVGVATAVCTGGPGALFWMEVAAVFGMATKYAEGLLAVKYRRTDKEGRIIGGPFCYIEDGMGKKWKWLAVLFAVFGAAAGLMGIGTITQINGITTAVHNLFDPDDTNTLSIFGREYSLCVIAAGALVTLLAALVIIGGIKRISKISEFVVPFMAVLYITCCVVLIICNFRQIPAAVATIIRGAFDPAAVTGGVVGTMMISVQKGIARGIFSNEAGLGSAPIAAAAARTNEPARQGLVSMTGTFIDTILICTMTGLAIVCTGAWQAEGLEGVGVTSYAFQKGLPFGDRAGLVIMMLCLVFFAFTTILGWNYYSERCLEYLVGDKKAVIMCFRALYIFMVFAGPYLTVDAVWNIADIFNGLMAFPNLIALFALRKTVKEETVSFFSRIKEKRPINERS